MKKMLWRIAVFLMLFSIIPANSSEIKSVKTNSQGNSSVLAAETSTPSIDCLIGHSNNKIEVVFSDIDGTIFAPNKENPMADADLSAKKAIIKLHEAKIPLILATGRIYPEARNLAQRLGVKNAYLISQQGAEIRDPQGKLIYQDGIKTTDFKEIINFLQDFKKQNNLEFKIIPAVDGKFYSNEEFEIPYIWSKIHKVNSFADLGENVKASSICIYEENPKEIKLVQATLKKHFPAYHIDVSAHCFCDVTSATATKGNAIKKMADLMGVGLKNCVTFGDAENDVSMLKMLKTNGGLAIAVGNAMPSVKENANFVTSSVYDGGFAKGIDEILKNNKILEDNKALSH